MEFLTSKNSGLKTCFEDSILHDLPVENLATKKPKSQILANLNPDTRPKVLSKEDMDQLLSFANTLCKISTGNYNIGVRAIILILKNSRLTYR